MSKKNKSQKEIANETTDEATSVPESEEQLVERARQALSSCNWEIGECASQWTTRYAKGRGDADFGAQLGMSGDQIYQRRRVWETFNDVQDQYASLSWSHFYAAVNWDDSAECLQWAEDEGQTVAGMRAWRRAARGEDLSVRSDSELDAIGGIDFVPETLSLVQSPDQLGGITPPWEGGDSEGAASAPATAVMGGVNQKLEGPDGDYTPFRSDARGDGKSVEARTPASPKVPLTGEKLLTRLITTVQRCHQLLDETDLKSLRGESSEMRLELIEKVDQFSQLVSKLS